MQTNADVSAGAAASHLAQSDPASPPWPSIRRRLTSPHGLLVLVCLAHAAAALAFLVSRHLGWEEDETVYLSQVAAHSPALTFTAPRARGLPILLFPVAHFTTSVTIIRTYLVVLGSLGLYIGLRPWLRLGFGRIVPGAALLFVTLWAATFFGAEAQPNFLVAVVCLGSVGYYLLAVRAERQWRHLTAFTGLVALLALIRPSDATWLAAPLALALIVIRVSSRRRRMLIGAALAVGLALGWSEWVIEAFSSYGGFFHRLHEANALNTPGLHFSILAQARAINGPTLCRPCHAALATSHFVWWFLAVPLAAVGLLSARGTRRFAPLAVAAAGGLALLLEYCLTISYAAPRFLLPTYALLALPCAAGVAALVRWRPTSAVNVMVISALAGLGFAQVASQTQYLHQQVAKVAASRINYVTAAATLRAAGVHAPCVIYGYYGPPMAYALGCNDHPVPPAVLPRVASGTTVVSLTGTAAGRGAFADWHDVSIAGTRRYTDWQAHILYAHSLVR